MLSTPNGCMCHLLKDGQVCIACRGRAKATAECTGCKVGLMPGEETERKKCTECYYDG